METIIAATDFSSTALNASKYAAAISAEIDAQLILVHVIEVPFTPMQVPLTTVEFEEIEKNAAQRLSELKEQLSFYTDNRINITTEIKYGFAEIVLEDFCKKVNPFAVVLGLSSDAPAARFFLGSTALRVVPYIQSPVLIIPDKAVFSGIKNITIASDSEQIHENITVQSIKKWLTMFHVQPDIVHVKTHDKVELQILTGNIFLYNHFSEFHPKYHSIHNKSVEDGIFGFIEEEKPDLLLVVPGRYSFFKKIFHASHSKQLILHSHLPVLVMHSHKSRGAEMEEERLHVHNKDACTGCDGLCCQNKKELKKHIDETHASA